MNWMKYTAEHGRSRWTFVDENGDHYAIYEEPVGDYQLVVWTDNGDTEVLRERFADVESAVNHAEQYK